MVVGTGGHARRTPRRPLQLAADPRRPESRQARSRPRQDIDRAGPRRLRRPARGGRVVAAEGLGPDHRHLPRAGRLGGADPALALGQPLRTAPRSPAGAIRGQLHRPGGAAKRRNAHPFRLTPAADPAGAQNSGGPAARISGLSLGPVPSLSPVADGAHGAGAVTSGPDRRLHGRRDHRRRRAATGGRIDGRAGRHGLLPSRHRPLRRPQPGRVAAVHADQAAVPHARGPLTAPRIAPAISRRRSPRRSQGQGRGSELASSRWRRARRGPPAPRGASRAAIGRRPARSR